MLSTLKVCALAAAIGIAPDPQSDIVEWGAKNIKLVDGPYAGQYWNPEILPYVKEPLRALMPDSGVNHVVIRKSAQTGLTTMGIVWTGYIVDQAPGNTLALFPTEGAMRSFNAEKLQPILDKSPVLVEKVAETKSRSAEGSTTNRKVFPGGFMKLGYASSSAALRQSTIQNMLRDEIDEYGKNVNNQGPALEQSDGRQKAFRAVGNWKTLDISTPTRKGESNIDAQFESGDQRFLQVACPECGHRHKLEWKNFRFEEVHPFKAWFECPANGCVIEERHKHAMVAGGQWVPENPGPGRPRSYHLWEAYSPLTTWPDIVSDYLTKDWVAFCNTTLGESAEIQGDAPDWEKLKLRESVFDYGEIPDSALFLTAGVDVQADRLEATLWGWGVGMTRYKIEHVVFEGDSKNPETWLQLTEWWALSRQTISGRERRIERIAVDSGYRPTMTYNWTRGKIGALAIKGVGGRTDWGIDQGRVISYDAKIAGQKAGKVMVHKVGTFMLKSDLYSALHLLPDAQGVWPLGSVHLGRGAPDEVLRQLVSETLVKVDKRDGSQASEWHRAPNVRNEVLDCAVYATAAAHDMRLHRVTPAQWQSFQRELGDPLPDAQQDLLERLQAAPLAPSAQPSKKPITKLAGYRGHA